MRIYRWMAVCEEGERMKDTTLDYYDEHAESFVQNTEHADMYEAADHFLSCLKPGTSVLDFGCGSGRDSLYFLKKGYRVTALDGSSRLCRFAEKKIGIPVRCEKFSDFRDANCYEGIWACASLLHVPSIDLPSLFQRLASALKEDGVLYVSFKYGDDEGERNGRYFTDLTEKKLETLIRGISSLSIQETWISGDVRQGRGNEKWLNALIRKGVRK